MFTPVVYDSYGSHSGRERSGQNEVGGRPGALSRTLRMGPVAVGAVGWDQTGRMLVEHTSILPVLVPRSIRARNAEKYSVLSIGCKKIMI
jgi:hypothetical protein